VQELDCDFYCFSGHKMYAPMGIGALYGKENLLDKMDPWQGGGEMIAQVTFDKTTYNEIPFKFEAGTPNVSGALGFEAAIHFLSNIGYDFIVNHKDDLLNYGHNRLAEIAGLKFHGTAKRKTGLISFNIEGVHPYDAAVLLDKLGVAIRTGHLCAQPTVDFYNVPGFIRASFGVYNTREEIDLLCDAIEKVKEILS
jgi:cysteine desulfurase/selenocysteine lyase